MNAWDNETEEQTRIRVALLNHPKSGAGPSAHNPWVGTRIEGSPWTAEQAAKIKSLGKDPDGKVWSHDVPCLMPDPKDPFGIHSIVYIRCPKLAFHKATSRVKVIAPDGVIYWTAAK